MRPFHFRQWLRVCTVKIGTSYFGNLFSTCQHKCWVTRAIYGIRWGLKSLTHNHSTRAGPVRIHCVITGMFDRDRKGHPGVIKMMPYNGYSQMLCISLKTEKSFIAHPWCLQPVVGLECIQWGWSAATARWGQGQWLGVSEPCAHIYS